MLKIHQPYKSKYIFAFVSIGVLLLGSTIIINSSSETSIVYAAGDSRTIHDISDMQEMTQQICSNTDENDTAVLTDNRDGYNTGTMAGSNGSTHNLNQYVVVKLKDGNCWMQENLRIIDAKIDNTDSDIENGSFVIPTRDITGFDGSDGDQVKTYYSSANYGAYYNWHTATAGTGTNNIANASVNSSICPKAWKLPTGGVSSQQYNLLSGLSLSGAISAPYNYTYSGFVWYSKLQYTGERAKIWSRTATSSPKIVYIAELMSPSRFDSYSTEHYSSGSSVRCLALGGLPKIEKPTWSETKDSNINVTMPTIITIDAASGMKDTAETNKITEGTIITKVTSNGEHEVSLSAAEPSLKDPKVSTAEISPVSSTNPVQPGNNAWGIWNSTTSTYDPITTEAKTYYETITNGADNQKVHTYQVGISISPALPAGTYATEVTVTASAK